jgi:hypothetical protein
MGCWIFKFQKLDIHLKIGFEYIHFLLLNEFILFVLFGYNIETGPIWLPMFLKKNNFISIIMICKFMYKFLLYC